ncbi:glucose-6-phosphate isomerase [Candidatus Contubernalis alkaliaceticus]|uniref:glucose-6-phosphate isomerase n=1 Tax=Candidatus Contubernalis alkaliaceticus TaxID=338645 RepID=UPI001F4C2EBC|nr:glucose-6-phosphate isomerase [Candidatus Contubernalis alkalaceticus]UNC91001.1 glucose-6-phosphate isomerase [Candidatus Contubernalis alkalaceticus]
MENNITLDCSGAEDYFKEHELDYLRPKITAAHQLLHNLEGPGSEYAGWIDWPLRFDQEELQRIQQVGQKIKEKAEVFVIIGIGGSYLGARSALELLTHSFYNGLTREERQGPEIYFAGHNISPLYLTQLLEVIKNKDVYINVVSKSGTTLEPALAFRVLKSLIEQQHGKKGAGERIFATTDQAKGALKILAEKEGYETFTVPDDVGGRFSVLTPVGLLPMAVGGINLEEIMAGARRGCELFSKSDIENNPSYLYGAIRNLLYQKGKTIELLVNYEPSLYYFGEWWKQLFGESEGKDHKGIFPAAMNFSTDLHSLGQYVQDGYRNLFLTTLWIEKPAVDMNIFEQEDNLDGLNYLSLKTIYHVNEKAFQGTAQAHIEGGVPNLKISVPQISPYYYGQMVYFFEKACGMSGYLLGVNPFDQPGVEAYKKNMFKLLGKP